MFLKKIAPVLLLSMMALSSACGKSTDTEKTNTDEIALQPLEEKKMTPEEEAEISVPEPDSVGNMMVYPSGYDETGALYGTNTLTFYFENEGVVGGDGLVYTYESPSGAAFASVSTSSSNVVVSPMDEAGVLYTGWEKGTKIDVCFDETFVNGKNYYVILDPGAFRLNENLSKSITNASLITFRVKDYGFEPFSTELENGSSIDAKIKLGGEAGLAKCELLAVSKEGVFTDLSSQAQSDDASSSEPVQFTEDGTFSPDLTGYDDSAVAIRFSYFSEDGKSIDSSTFIVTVGNPTAEDLVSIRSHIYGDGSAAEETFADGEDPSGMSETDLTESGSTPSVVIEEPLNAPVQDFTENPAIEEDQSLDEAQSLSEPSSKENENSGNKNL